jgi:hypothetical protein
LLVLAPVLVVALALVAAELMDRRHPGRYAREEEQRAERERDEILSS